MNLWDNVIKTLDLKLQTSPQTLGRQIQGAFCGDLLSDVLAYASPGYLWITIHRHRNIVAVATLVNLSGIIITGNRKPDEDTLQTAEKEGLPLFTTPLDNFYTSGKLYHILSDNSIL